MPIEVYKQLLYTCQAETVADSSLTPSVALLVCARSNIYCTVMNLQGLKNVTSENRPGYL